MKDKVKFKLPYEIKIGYVQKRSIWSKLAEIAMWLVMGSLVGGLAIILGKLIVEALNK